MAARAVFCVCFEGISGERERGGLGKRKEQGEKPFVFLSSWEGDAAACEQDGFCDSPT